MNGIGLEIALVFVLVVANGIFSMAEMAVVSARKARLRQRADEGSKGAAVALALAESPDDFLSTVQVGITLIGTLAGAFGGATIAEKVAVELRAYPEIAPYADSISLAAVVLLITYLSLIIGELVPKTLALRRAEAIASVLAPVMRWLSRLGSPAVRFLSFSTQLVMKLLPLGESQEAPVTEEEVKVLVAQGTTHGTFHAAEREMVEGVFRLGDRRVSDFILPRNKLIWLDAEDPWPVNEAKILHSRFSWFLVAESELDRLIGIVHVKDLFAASRHGAEPDLRSLARKPVYIHEGIPALSLIEKLRETGEALAVVIDEHGGIEGIVTMGGVTGAIVGETNAGEVRQRIVHMEDGSWLADGALPVLDLEDALNLRDLPGEKGDFATLAGYILFELGRIPERGDSFSSGGWRFEVLEMDGNRISKVSISKDADAG